MRHALLAIMLVACAKDAHQLSPFPCADDLTCPAGLACVDGQCATAAIDAICTVGSDPTDCSAAGQGAICSAKGSTGLDTGACEQPCSNGQCPTGRACSNSGADSVCLVDCNAGAACPANTYCLARPDGHKVCMPAGLGCRALENVKRCTPSLCTGRWQAVTCPDNTSHCPEDSTCSSNSRTCTCTAGHEAYDCNDQPCNNTCGGSRSYWCAPSIANAGCTTNLDGIEATCDCWTKTIAISCERSGVTCDELCRR